jgi:hypothetical protein
MKMARAEDNVLISLHKRGISHPRPALIQPKESE